MTVTHYLITDSHAEEVEAKTGLRGHNTPLGVLIEKPKETQWRPELAEIKRALNPNRCTCGAWSILHRPCCPVGDVGT